jgi:hypothetical protein
MKRNKPLICYEQIIQKDSAVFQDISGMPLEDSIAIFCSLDV